MSFKSLSNENKEAIREVLDRNYLMVKNVRIHFEDNRFTVIVKEGVDTLLTEFQFNSKDNISVDNYN